MSAELLNDISQLLPSVFIEQVILESFKDEKPAIGEPEKIRVRVTLSLKDIIEDDNVSQWFAEQDMQQFIKAHCYLVKDESFIDAIYLNDQFGYADIEERKNDLNIGKLVPTIQKNNLKITLPYTAPNNNSNQIIQEDYVTINDKNEREVTFPIKTEFTTTIYDDEKFLGLFAFLTFDLKAFASKFNITDVNANDENALSRNFSSEVILRDGLVSSEKQYFVIEETGEFYYGQFHAIQNEFDNNVVYRTGLVEGEGQFLKLQTESNYVVSDFRFRKFSNKNLIDETGMVNNFFKTPQQFQNLKKDSRGDLNSKYFSEPLISVDEKGNCRFTFFFDKENFILDNCFYKPILTPSKIAENVKINNVRVYRIRKEIKEINDKSENKETLVAYNNYSFSSPFGSLSPANVPNNISYIAEVATEGVTTYSTINYCVYDAEINQSNYGLYKYKVVLDIVDPTVNLLKELIFSITKNSGATLEDNGLLLNLQNYYSFATSSKKKSPEKFGSNQTISRSIPYYNILKEKFEPSFFNDYRDLAKIVQTSLETFLNNAVLIGYISFSNEKEKEAAIISLRNMISPISGSPDSIKIIIKIVEDFVQFAKNKFGFEDSEIPSRPKSKKTNSIILEFVFDNSKAYTLDVNNKYDKYFNSTFSNGVGFKIIEPSKGNINFGLNSVKLLDYKRFTDIIAERYFNNLTSFNIFDLYEQKVSQKYYNFEDDFKNEDSKYSYLPASSINTLGNTYIIDKSVNLETNQQFYLDMFLDIVNYNTLKLSKFTSQSNYTSDGFVELSGRDLTNSQLLDIFSDSSFSSLALEDISEIIEAIPKFTNNKTIQGFINTFGQASEPDFNNKIDSQTKQVQKSSKFISSNSNSLLFELLLRELFSSQEVLDSARNFADFNPLTINGELNPTFFVNQKAFIEAINNPDSAVSIVQNFIRDLPIPIKFLISTKEFFKNSFNIENFFKFWILFKKIYTVEYFDGFEKISGKSNLKKPIWKTVTINKLENSKKQILCRLRQYKPDETINKYFPSASKLDLPIFDEYFYIIPNENVDLDNAIELSIPVIFPIIIPPLPEIIPPNKGGPVSDIFINNAIKKTAQALSQQREEVKLPQNAVFNTPQTILDFASKSSSSRKKEENPVDFVSKIYISYKANKV